MEQSWDPTDLVHPGSNYDQSQARRHSRTARPAQALSSDRGRLHSTGHGRRPCHHPAAGQHQQRLAIVSDIGTSYVGQHIIAKLRKELGEKVLSAPIEQIERYRTHRLIPVLTHDIDTISDFSFSFTPLAIALTITFGCLGYLAYLSVPMFLLTVVAIVIGTAAQYLARSRGFKGFYAARDLEDELQKHYTAIASGAKELRIHRPRRYRMHTSIYSSWPRPSARCCSSW